MILSKQKTLVIILTIILAVGIINIYTADSLAIEDIGELQNELSQDTPAAKQSNNIAVEFIKLLFVLIMIIGAAWSVVKLFGQKATARLQGTWLHVVDEVILGQSRGIILCEVGQKVYAVGVTDHNISLLFEIDNPKLMEDIAAGDYMQPDRSNNLKIFKNGVSKLLTGNENLSNRKNFHYLMEEQNQRLQEMFKYDLSNKDEKIRRSDNNG